MVAKEEFMREIESLPKEFYAEILDFVGYLKLKRLRNIPETMIMSEQSLAEDWNTPEEDHAWADL